MREAEINDAITKLYDKVNTYYADDWWYFDMPLAIRLRKPLHSRRRWLVNARILVNKLADRASIGQTMMNQYFAHIPSIWTVRNASLERIKSVRGYIQTNLLSLWGSRTPGPGWKLSSRSLWYCISLFYLRWCRRWNYYSCRKM
jgi:hypothetical protein